MDIIQSAIENGNHMTNNNALDKQTWEQFMSESRHRKIFLFGLGTAAEYFIYHYHDKVRLDGVIDNDKAKHGYLVGDFSVESFHTEIENIYISDISILKKYSDEEVSVIITSTRFYAQMIQQLRNYNITSYFLMLTMEANRRKQEGLVREYDEKKEKEYFLKECESYPIDARKIVISIGNYGGHGKYITRQLLKCCIELDIIWVVNDLSLEHPKGVRLVREANWKKYIYEMETAHIWIYDVLVPDYIRKRIGQFYIQTKHWSSVTLKKFFLDDLSTISSAENIAKVKRNGKKMDYIFTGSQFDDETCRKGFDFRGECVRIGSARTDALFYSENKEKVFRRYSIEETAQCVLYAPTFRFSKEEKKKSFTIELDLERLKSALEKRFGGNWYILLRLHPSLAKENSDRIEKDYVVDAGDYDDVQELVAASDITISDYSSIMFEPAFVHKPVFLFAPDREKYVNKERDLLIDYDTLPFDVAETNEKLEEKIEAFEQLEYEHRVDTFLERYGVHEDGHASERAADFILKLIKTERRDL